MRSLPLLCFLPLLAACDARPAPDAEPPEAPDPVVVQAETDRRDVLTQAARKGDFEARFGEPFITFDTRGTKVGVSQPYAQPSYRVVEAQRTQTGNTFVFRSEAGLYEGDAPFVLTIRKRDCRDEFSGEQTAYTAWLGTDDAPRALRSCAAPAKR